MRLAGPVGSWHKLNMFKTRPARRPVKRAFAAAAAPGKADATRALLLESALKLFRKRGFEQTTMRDIAAEAEMSLGSTYYYFSCKEELVLAYYQELQARYEAVLDRKLGSASSLEQRISLLLHAKLDLIARDRNFLGALFRFVGEPKHPLSPFSEGSRLVRGRALASIDRALAGAALPAEVAVLAAQALWLLHLGLILYAVHDDSRGLTKTRALADLAAAQSAQLISLATLPGFANVLKVLARKLPKVSL